MILNVLLRNFKILTATSIIICCELEFDVCILRLITWGTGGGRADEEEGNISE